MGGGKAERKREKEKEEELDGMLLKYVRERIKARETDFA